MSEEKSAPKPDEEPAKKGRKRTQVDLDKTIPTAPASSDPIHPGGAPPPVSGTYTEVIKFTCPICLKKVAIDVAVNNAEKRPCHKECLEAAKGPEFADDIGKDPTPDKPPLGPISPPEVPASVPQTKEEIMSQMEPVESIFVEDGETTAEEPFRKAGVKASRFKAKMIVTIECKIESLEKEKHEHLLKAEDLSTKIEALNKTLEVFSEPESES